MSDRDWLLEDNEKTWAEEGRKARESTVAKYGPICEQCGWPVNHPTVQTPWVKPGEHDCYTGDPLAR